MIGKLNGRLQPSCGMVQARFSYPLNRRQARNRLPSGVRVVGTSGEIATFVDG